MKDRIKDLITEYRRIHKRPDGSDYTQVEIAVMAGVNPTTLSIYINGHNGSYQRRMMTQLAKFFYEGGVLSSAEDILYFDFGSGEIVIEGE